MDDIQFDILKDKCVRALLDGSETNAHRREVGEKLVALIEAVVARSRVTRIGKVSYPPPLVITDV